MQSEVSVKGHHVFCHFKGSHGPKVREAGVWLRGLQVNFLDQQENVWDGGGAAMAEVPLNTLTSLGAAACGSPLPLECAHF